ncbi:MAG: restriction endonuclease subunit S [Porticoccaceae bacterium]
MGGEWKTASLGEICDFRAGSVFKPDLQGRTSGEIPFVKVSDINLPANAVRIQDANNWVSAADLRELRAKPLPPGTVVFAKIGEALRQNRLRQIARETIIDNNMMGAVPRSGRVEPRFLYYALSRFDFSDIAQGTALPYLTVGSLTALTLNVPPLAEQRAIAHILGTLDDKIELNRRGNQTLEAMARALFKDWFVDFGPVRAKMEAREPYLPADLWQLFPDSLDDEGKPDGWSERPLADFIDIHDSRRVPLSGKQRAKRQGPYPYHGAAGVMDGVDDFLFDGVHVLLGEDGSVVKADGRPYTQYVWGKFWVNNHAHVLRGRGITSETLLVFLDQCDVAPFVTGAVQPKLSQGNLKAIPFIDAGDAVLQRFGEIVDPLFAQIRGTTEESRTLAQLRDTLLPKLISGELRIKDAEQFVEAAQ